MLAKRQDSRMWYSATAAALLLRWPQRAVAACCRSRHSPLLLLLAVATAHCAAACHRHSPVLVCCCRCRCHHHSPLLLLLMQAFMVTVGVTRACCSQPTYNSQHAKQHARNAVVHNSDIML